MNYNQEGYSLAFKLHGKLAVIHQDLKGMHSFISSYHKFQICLYIEKYKYFEDISKYNKQHIFKNYKMYSIYIPNKLIL